MPLNYNNKTVFTRELTTLPIPPSRMEGIAPPHSPPPPQRLRHLLSGPMDYACACAVILVCDCESVLSGNSVMRKLAAVDLDRIDCVDWSGALQMWR